MAYRRKSNKLVWALILAGLVIVGSKFSNEVKTFVQKIPVVGNFLFPAASSTSK